MGFKKVWDPDKAVLIYDHLVPASQQDDTRHYQVGEKFIRDCGLTHVHRSDGICHQLMTEAGYVKPTLGRTVTRPLMDVWEHFLQGLDIPRWLLF